MKNHKLNLEPCPDCPYPMDVLINPLPKEQGATCQKFDVTCRECGDNWIEETEDGVS
jgi:hypothetical protein